jgi:SAM-dependent methyltransferase
VDRADYSRITHGDLRLLNPLSSERVDEVLDLLELDAGDRVIDIGCGKGELLIRVGERFDIEGLGIDLSKEYVAWARNEAMNRVPNGQITFVTRDASKMEPTPRSFDLAINVGSSHVFGDYETALRRLHDIVKPGGLVLFGEGFWRREPSPDFLEALGGTADELADYAGLISTCIASGFTPIYTLVSSDEDWDRYEWSLIRNGELYAARNPSVPGVEGLLDWVRHSRDRFVTLGGRETFGFCLLLLMAA